MTGLVIMASDSAQVTVEPESEEDARVYARGSDVLEAITQQLEGAPLVVAGQKLRIKKVVW